MRNVRVHFEGIAPYSQSKMHEEPKLPKETADAYETRTWRSKCTVDKDGNIIIPAMAIKFSLSAAAKKLGTQIPGRGKSTYTKYFEADVVPLNDPKLDTKQEDVKVSASTLILMASEDQGSASGVPSPSWTPDISLTLIL